MFVFDSYEKDKMIEAILAQIDQNDIHSQENANREIEDLLNKDPFSFIVNGIIEINSNPSEKGLINKIIIYISSALKTKEIESIWLNEDFEKKQRIKNTFFQLTQISDKGLYENIAEDIFLIGKIEFPNHQWDSFFSDIFNLISNENDQNCLYTTPLALYIIHKSINYHLLNNNFQDFDMFVTSLYDVFKNYISIAESSFQNDTYGELLLEIKKKCFEIMKISMPFLEKLFKQPIECSRFVDILFLVDDKFRKDIYILLSTLYKYYYDSAVSCMKNVYKFSMNDITINLNENDDFEKQEIDQRKKVYAISFWNEIAKIENTIENSLPSFDCLKKHNHQTSHYFILGAYKTILPKLFQIFEIIYCFNERKAEIDIDIRQEKLEYTSLECLKHFALVEPKYIIPEIADFFREHIRKPNNSFKYSALKVFSTVLDICEYKIVSDFLVDIYECVEKGNNTLCIAALSFIVELIKLFSSQLPSETTTHLLLIIKNRLDLKQSYEILSQILETKLYNASDDFNEIKNLLMQYGISKIHISFPAIISFIKKAQNSSSINQIYEQVFLKLQSIKEESDDDLLQDVCAILKECILGFEGTENISEKIKPLCNSILFHMGKNDDQYLFDLISSFCQYIFENDPTFLNQIIPHIINALDSNNAQLIDSSSTLLSNLFSSNTNIMKGHLEVFQEKYIHILTSNSSLRDVHPFIISSIADIINCLGHESLDLRTAFLPIFGSFVNMPLNKNNKNDIEYAKELFLSLLRSFTAITNFIDDSPESINEVAKYVFTLYKKIYSFQFFDGLMLDFIVCIVNSLYCINKNRITFMIFHESVKSLIHVAIQSARSELFREKANILYTIFYPKNLC